MATTTDTSTRWISGRLERNYLSGGRWNSACRMNLLWDGNVFVTIKWDLREAPGYSVESDDIETASDVIAEIRKVGDPAEWSYEQFLKIGVKTAENDARTIRVRSDITLEQANVAEAIDRSVELTRQTLAGKFVAYANHPAGNVDTLDGETVGTLIHTGLAVPTRDLDLIRKAFSIGLMVVQYETVY